MPATNRPIDYLALRWLASEVTERMIWTDTISSVGARFLFLLLPAIPATIALLISIGVLDVPIAVAWVAGLCLFGLYLWQDFWGLIRKEAPTFTFRREIVEVDGEPKVVGGGFEQAIYELNRSDLLIWRLSGLCSLVLILSSIGVIIYTYVT